MKVDLNFTEKEKRFDMSFGQLQSQPGNGGDFKEKDPTVPSWAKQPTKPTYTAKEVGALPNDAVIPISHFENDVGYAKKDEVIVIPVSATAKVGQIIKVSSVDEDGRPAEWSFDDAPYSKNEIDNILGGYITEIDALIGGDD